MGGYHRSWLLILIVVINLQLLSASTDIKNNVSKAERKAFAAKSILIIASARPYRLVKISVTLRHVKIFSATKHGTSESTSESTSERTTTTIPLLLL